MKYLIAYRYRDFDSGETEVDSSKVDFDHFPTEKECENLLENYSSRNVKILSVVEVPTDWTK